MGKIQKFNIEKKFQLGRLVWTKKINDRIAKDEKFTKFIWRSLKRHAKGDWGELSKEDWKENEFSLNKNLRLFSSYDIGLLEKIWIITEADRSSTTILFPEEY